MTCSILMASGLPFYFGPRHDTWHSGSWCYNWLSTLLFPNLPCTCFLHSRPASKRLQPRKLRLTSLQIPDELPQRRAESRVRESDASFRASSNIEHLNWTPTLLIWWVKTLYQGRRSVRGLYIVNRSGPLLSMYKHLVLFLVLLLQGLLAVGFTNPIKQTDGSDPFMVGVLSLSMPLSPWHLPDYCPPIGLSWRLLLFDDDNVD